MHGANALPDALIGHTGFVGSNLLKSDPDFELFNSRNIRAIRGRQFRRIVCAGVTAVKWWANSHPGEDRAGIDTLTDCLRQTAAESFTLISTIDVYGLPHGVTEDDRPVPAENESYGLHRLALEDFVAENFDQYHIVRLPALFGPGLKKNAVFDLMHARRLELINPASSFQWYPVARLGSDLRVFEAAGFPVINVATEPLPMQALHETFFSGEHIGASPSPATSYDMRTRYDSLLKGRGGYFLRRAAVIDALASFLAQQS